MHFQLFLLIITFGAIFSNALVESVLTSAELSLDRSVRILVSEMKNLKDRMQKMEQIHQETVEDNRNLRTLVNSLSSKNEELESRLYYVEQFQRNRHQNDEFEDASDVLNSSENNSNKSSGVELGPFANTMKSLGHGIHSGRKTRSAESVSASGEKQMQLGQIYYVEQGDTVTLVRLYIYLTTTQLLSDTEYVPS